MVAFADLGLVAAAADLDGTEGVVGWDRCEAEWKAPIQRVQRRTLQLGKYGRRDVLNAQSSEDDFLAVTGLNLPIRSSHGSAALQPAPYADRPGGMSIAQEAWYIYADNFKTQHCPAGAVPAYIEFHIAGGGGLRILYGYIAGQFLITDHYETYYRIDAPDYP